ncbi:MAG: membrane dipeptidase [Gemmatimonadaceae bacterium]|nr:membrane dipeptidase [Gemmatimonadaceae bacterium]
MALGHTPGDYASAIRFFADWNGFVAEHPDWFMRIDDASDFEAVKKSGKVGIMITFQNSDHFRTVDDVDTFFALGQRISQLTYNYQNRLGCGFLEDNDGGLTVFGKQIVERMNKVGMAVDISHCAESAAKRPAPWRCWTISRTRYIRSTSCTFTSIRPSTPFAEPAH